MAWWRSKTIVAIALMLPMAWAIGGCGSKETAETSEEEPPPSRVTIGLAFLADGDVDAGLEQLAQAAEQPTEGVVPAWYAQAIDDLLRWRHLDEADSMLAMMGPIQSRPPAFVLRTAHVARLRGLPEEALGLYADVKGDPGLQAEAAEEMALIYRAQEECEQALEVSQPYLQGDQVSGRLREIAAACLLDLSRPREALAQARQMSPGATQATVEGEAWLALDQPDSALPCLQQAIQLSPRSPQARYLLGQAFLETGQERFAAQMLGPLAEADPPYDDAQLYFSQALRADGKTAQADSVLAEYERVAAEREMFELRFQGLLASKEGRLDDALHYLNEALEKAPENGNLHNDIGIVLARQKKYDEAEAAFERAKELMPRDISVQTNLLRLYESKGDSTRAREARVQLDALTNPAGSGRR